MEKSIKILSVNTFDFQGGAAKAAYRIHTGINQMGGHSQMFVKEKQTNDKNVIPLSEFIPNNIIYKFYNYIENKIKNKIQHFRWNKYPNRDNVFLSDLRSVSMHGAFQKINFDVLHLNWVNLRFLDLRELRKIDKPIVWTLHDSWTFTGICHYFYDCNNYQISCGHCPFLGSNKDNDLSHQIWNKKNKIYSKIKLHIVTPSKWLADLVEQSSLLGRFEVTVIPNPLDTKVFSSGNKKIARDKLGLNRDVKIILFGSVNPVEDKNKGFDKLLEALKFIEKNFKNQKILLAVFGTNKTIDLNINLPIINLGFIDSNVNLVNAYRSADVMVVPSLSEVFGQTASEAMACGTPVVAFNCTGIKEVVDHKQNGFLAKPYDSEDLAKGIEWCLKNNEDNHLSVNARKKVEENYSMEIVAKKYMELYKQIVNQ